MLNKYKNEPYNQHITLMLHITYLDHSGGNLLVYNLDSHSHPSGRCAVCPQLA